MNGTDKPRQEVSEGEPSRTESVGGGTPPEGRSGEEGPEWWVRTAIALAILSVLGWGVVYARLGTPSLYAQIFVVPIIGGLTLPVILWGLIKTAFNPPVLRRWRVVGFGVLLAVAVFGTVPMFEVPLATAGWESETRFRLPFRGEWYTLAGGSELERNYHATTAAYRWGYDFAPVEDGERFEGQGRELDEYYCFGKPVVAPADGEVVKVEHAQKDYPPREFDETSALGNHVVLRIEEGVYLFAAHLKKGSVPVEPSEEVDRGAKIGECGNSGRAVEPHVHVHLQDRVEFPVAQSLPLRFSNYVADGEKIEKGMPLGEGEGGEPQGQTVRMQRPSSEAAEPPSDHQD